MVMCVCFANARAQKQESGQCHWVRWNRLELEENTTEKKIPEACIVQIQYA